MRRTRDAKIVATLGPSSRDEKTIGRLFDAGVDVFRLNFSHGSHKDHTQTFKLIRAIEAQRERSIGILADLQGPKLRVGGFENKFETLMPGDTFRFDLDSSLGNATRAPLLHPEIFSALSVGSNLLINDGKIRLKVLSFDDSSALTEVIVGGQISSNKGVNVPDMYLPISVFTQKDRADLDCALSLGVDWVAASFVQKPSDIQELRDIVGDQVAILAKLEKPMAIDHLTDIIKLSDGVMVARGDLGVEMPQERVPVVQKRIIRCARQEGKPVIVATQMLESMIDSPVPTRAESSDVATAIYDGADAVMLSAETAAGSFPVDAVSAMNRIIEEVENDDHYRRSIDATQPSPGDTAADAISSTLHHVASVLPLAATITFTESGFSAFRSARERPEAPLIGCTPHVKTARRLTLVWGVHPVLTDTMKDVDSMVNNAVMICADQQVGKTGQTIAITAGMPFGRTGTTNMLRLTQLESL